MTAADSGSRARHPSNSGTPVAPQSGGAGPLQLQRRRVYYSASLLTLALVVLAAVNPVAGVWLAKGVLAYLTAVTLLWAAAGAVRWRAQRRFTRHVNQSLWVVR